MVRVQKPTSSIGGKGEKRWYVSVIVGVVTRCYEAGRRGWGGVDFKSFSEQVEVSACSIAKASKAPA